MNENALKSIENNLRKVAEQITEFDVESKYKSVMHDGIGYSLPSDSERLFNDIGPK